MVPGDGVAAARRDQVPDEGLDVLVPAVRVQAVQQGLADCVLHTQHTKVVSFFFNRRIRTGQRARETASFRIRKFLGLPHPEQDKLVGGADPNPDPFTLKQK